MNLNQRIDPKRLSPHLGFFSATEIMTICEYYELVDSCPGGGSDLAADAAACPGGLIEKLAELRAMILCTHVDALHCGRCGRLYAPTTHEFLSDATPWDEACGECGAQQKTRTYVLPLEIQKANPTRSASK